MDRTQSTAVMASPRLSTAELSKADLANLPERLDDTTLARLETFCRLPCPAPEPFDDEHFAKAMRVLIAALPKRNADDVSGELFVAAYRKKLAHLPLAAINYAFDQALTRCQWFPTIAELLKFAAEWKPVAGEFEQLQITAERLVRSEREKCMDETMAALQRGELDGEQIAALPEWHRRVAITRGLIWANEDGSYRPRPDPIFLEAQRA